MKKLSILIFLWCLCVVANAGAINVATTYDQYSKGTGIATDKYSVPGINSFLSPAFALAFLAGRVGDNGTESIFMRVHYEGDGWRFFQSAQDIDGNSLPVSVVDNQVLSGTQITEEFDVLLTKDYVERHQASGFDIRIAGKYGTMVIKLPAEYLSAFMGKFNDVEEVVKAKLDAAPAPTTNKVKLGVKYSPVNDGIATLAKIPAGHGVMLAVVDPDGTAGKSGLRNGDVILRVGEHDVAASMTGLADAISDLSPGDKAPFQIWRGGQQQTIDVQF